MNECSKINWREGKWRAKSIKKQATGDLGPLFSHVIATALPICWTQSKARKHWSNLLQWWRDSRDSGGHF